MTQSDPSDLLRRALAASPQRPAGPATPECLDDETVAALAEGGLDAAQRAAAVDHLATCQRCLTAVASVAGALIDSKVSREVARSEGHGRLRFYRMALPVAAAAALLILVLPRRTNDIRLVHRAPTITATAAPVPVSPMGIVAVPDLLRWASVTGADRYRVTLFDAGSRVLYERELTDTVAAIPDSMHFAAGRPYLWKVEARTGWNRWVSSSLVEFRVGGAAR